MTYSEVETAVYNWVSANTTLTVIFADENGPKPDSNYISLKINSYTMQGQRDYTAPDGITGIRTVRIDEDFVLSITSFGIGSQNELQKLKLSLQKESVIVSLATAGLAVRGEETINDISTLIDDVIEKRYIYEVTMGFAHSFTETSGVIETFEITSDYN